MPKTANIDIAQFISDRESNMTNIEIAKKHGISEATVLNYVNRLGLTKKSRKQIFNKIDTDQFILDRESNMTNVEIAEKHGISEATVINYVVR